jgi:uncharacterized damage-inducible protein DinB
MSNNIAQAYIGELQMEAATARKCLERIPAEMFSYKPHEKSMEFGRLASHVAEMFGWATSTCTLDQIDFAAGDYTPFNPTSSDELLAFFDNHVNEAVAALNATSDEDMMKPWSLKNGETTYFTMPKVQVLRGMVFNHIVHHRGQLTVYMRLNDIPVPGIYGPSADEPTM